MNSDVKQNTTPLQNQKADEIDLIELLINLWRQRQLIFIIAFTFLSLAAAYIFFSKPVFQARAILTPPKSSDIFEYNLERSGISLEAYEEKVVYEFFRHNLFSDSLRIEFFNEVFIPTLSEGKSEVSKKELLETFNQSLLVKWPTRSRPNHYEVVVEWHEPLNAKKWLTNFLEKVRLKTLEDIQNAFKQEVDVLAKSHERKIDALRSMNSDYKENIDERRRLEVALTLIKSVDIDSVQPAVYNFDEDVKVSEKPIRPKKILVLSIGLIFGLVIGILTAFVKHLVNSNQIGAVKKD